jgi:hypothetical protein
VVKYENIQEKKAYVSVIKDKHGFWFCCTESTIFRGITLLLFIMCSSYSRIFLFPYLVRLTQRREHTVARLMRCAASLNVLVSIPDEGIGFFSLPNPSRPSMPLGSTQPLTEMTTKNIPGVLEPATFRLVAYCFEL